MATSARYPPLSGECSAVPAGHGVEVAEGTTGKVGSGVYSIAKWEREAVYLFIGNKRAAVLRRSVSGDLTKDGALDEVNEGSIQ